jgi:predicted transcriptional regulator
MEKAQKNLAVGKDPICIAASILYIVNLSETKPRTLAEIAKAAGITEVTMRNRSKELRKKLNVSDVLPLLMKRKLRSTILGEMAICYHSDTLHKVAESLFSTLYAIFLNFSCKH